MSSLYPSFLSSSFKHTATSLRTATVPAKIIPGPIQATKNAQAWRPSVAPLFVSSSNSSSQFCPLKPVDWSLISTLANSNCTETSECSEDGPGNIQCLCKKDYHGYKCLEKVTNPTLPSLAQSRDSLSHFYVSLLKRESFRLWPSPFRFARERWRSALSFGKLRDATWRGTERRLPWLPRLHSIEQVFLLCSSMSQYL